MFIHPSTMAACHLTTSRTLSRTPVEPVLKVHKVEARLVALRFEHGLLSKNKYIMGLMGGREAWHHFLVGVAGPEAALIHELNNEDFPRRLTAEVGGMLELRA